MTADMAAQILRETLLTALWLTAPLLAIALAAGILISLVQIVTSIQDPGFSTIPRLAVFLASILLMMPWMLQRIMTYAISIFGNLHRYAH
jgi:flagellar biosynthetic protein FliQ